MAPALGFGQTGQINTGIVVTDMDATLHAAKNVADYYARGILHQYDSDRFKWAAAVSEKSAQIQEQLGWYLAYALVTLRDTDGGRLEGPFFEAFETISTRRPGARHRIRGDSR